MFCNVLFPQSYAACSPYQYFVTGTKEILSNMYSNNHEDAEHFNRACTETTAGHDTSTVDSHPFPEVTTKNAEVKCLVEVKVESADLGCSRNSGPHTEGGEEDYCPDSLSLAQTRLLEDWRPEALQLPHRDPDSFTPSTSHSLSKSLTTDWFPHTN